jgi:hypothetical protein
MAKLGLLAAAIVVIIIIATAVLLLAGPKPAETAPESTVPILLYGRGLPYVLYNLSSSLEIAVLHGNVSSSFNYSNFKPAALASSAMYAASLNRSWSNATADFLIKKPQFYFEGENNSFGNGNISLPLRLGNLPSANVVIVGLRMFPLAYYSSAAQIALRTGLYPVYYIGNISNIHQFVYNESVPGTLQYNVSIHAPVTFKMANTSSGYVLEVNVANNWNRTLKLTNIEVVGYFLGSESRNFKLPPVNVVSNGDAYTLEAINSLKINMNLTSTQSYLQTNASAVGKFVSEANSGSITSSAQFYSDFNATLNVSRLDYLESLMLENQSYYVAMHELENFDPLNGSVVEYAGRISAWENAYHGLLDFNVSGNKTLSLPRSVGALNYSSLTISPGESASLVYDIGNLSYMGQSTTPINGMNYTVFAYFDGVVYSDSMHA